jgi:hypothetical protein
VGALIGLVWMGPGGILGAALAAAGLLLALALALSSLRRASGGEKGPAHAAWLRGECVALGVAFLGALAYLAASLLYAARDSRYLSGVVAAAVGLVALVVITVGDWRTAADEPERYALVSLSWLGAIKLGVLGAWLLVRASAGVRLTAWDQTLLSLIILAVIISLLSFLRWRTSSARHSGEAGLTFLGARDELGILASLNSWGGFIAPAALLALTIANGWTYTALLAWLLLLAGDGLWRNLLTAPRR